MSGANAWLVVLAELFYDDERFEDVTDDGDTTSQPQRIFFDREEAEAHGRALQRQLLRGNNLDNYVPEDAGDEALREVRALQDKFGWPAWRPRFVDPTVPPETSDEDLDRLVDLFGLRLYRVLPAVVRDEPALRAARDDLERIAGEGREFDDPGATERLGEITRLFGRGFDPYGPQ